MYVDKTNIDKTLSKSLEQVVLPSVFHTEDNILEDNEVDATMVDHFVALSKDAGSSLDVTRRRSSPDEGFFFFFFCFSGHV
jgi:hypothetical protein